jgi:hypothetical protein
MATLIYPAWTTGEKPPVTCSTNESYSFPIANFILMNDPQLALNKLSDLGRAAVQASSEADRAAIFAAVHILTASLDEDECVPEYLAENIERVRWSISAILGYDIDNGHDQVQHLSWALGAIDTLRDACKQT